MKKPGVVENAGHGDWFMVSLLGIKLTLDVMGVQGLVSLVTVGLSEIFCIDLFDFGVLVALAQGLIHVFLIEGRRR